MEPIEDTMFGALAVLRLITLANTVVLYLIHRRGYDHPHVGWALLAGIAVWTVVVTLLLSRARSRRAWVFGLDLIIAVGAILATPYVKGPGLSATLPGFWVSTVVLGWAIRWQVRGGLLAAVVISVADLSIRVGAIEQADYGNIFLLLVGGLTVGFLSAAITQVARERDEAHAVAAAASERQRLARVVHDGVLQVLAMVQRRGPELGPQGAELARLAGDQEARLRTLVQGSPAPDKGGSVDLGSKLSAMADGRVSVAVPATPVSMSGHAAAELTAVVQACLDNVRVHAGPDAKAWVLLEEDGDEWAISVRDDGPGIPDGRLDEAANQGRLGISQSILGRIRDLRGRAQLHTGPKHGTEWEFRGSMAVAKGRS